jgi:AraC-like DNA-binding protein
MPRLEQPIDLDQLESLMRLKPTLADTAAFFKCSERTIERYIKDNFNVTFVEFRNQNMVHTRLTLVREALKQAQNGNTALLIFCLKNLCGWSDKIEHGFDKDKKTILLKYNLEQDQTEPLDVTPAIKNVDSKD